MLERCRLLFESERGAVQAEETIFRVPRGRNLRATIQSISNSIRASPRRLLDKERESPGGSTNRI